MKEDFPKNALTENLIFREKKKWMPPPPKRWKVFFRTISNHFSNLNGWKKNLSPHPWVVLHGRKISIFERKKVHLLLLSTASSVETLFEPCSGRQKFSLFSKATLARGSWKRFFPNPQQKREKNNDNGPNVRQGFSVPAADKIVFLSVELLESFKKPPLSAILSGGP